MPKAMFHVVIVGDSNTGKSSILSAYKNGEMSNEENSDLCTTFTQKVKVDGRKVEIGFWDTSGEPQYEGLRKLTYRKCNAFLVCYSVDSRESFDNVTKIWLPELKKHGPPNVSVVILATKKDLQQRRSGEGFVSHDEGLQLANENKAAAFLECSAINATGLQTVFQQIAKVILKQYDEEKAKNKRK